MKLFVTKQEFKDLNVGFAFDEGGPSPNDYFAVFYAERAIWRKSPFPPSPEEDNFAYSSLFYKYLFLKFQK